MRIYLILVCGAFVVISGSAQSHNAENTSERPIVDGSNTAASPDTNATAIVKGYADKIQKGMSKADAEQITGTRGNPKENNPPHEQVFHYDYDHSYIRIIYSVDIQNSTFAVLDKLHIVDNLTIVQRNEKRREAFARWVQQRKEIMKKRETEREAPHKTDAGDAK